MRLFLVLCMASSLWADGGKVVFQRKAGSLNITLFSTESPVRVGRPDLSVMVQNTADQSPVLDADVIIHLIRHDANTISGISAPARHDKATNKLLYAARMDINAPGQYRVEISVQNKKESALVAGEIEVSPPEPPLLAHWPYFVALPVVALLFALNQRLKRKRNVASRQ